MLPRRESKEFKFWKNGGVRNEMFCSVVTAVDFGMKGFMFFDEEGIFSCI